MTQKQRRLTDVVERAGTELAVELLGSEASEVMDGKGPKMQHIVPGESVSLLNHHNLAAQQGELNGCSQATRTPSDDQTLHGVKKINAVISYTRCYEKTYISYLSSYRYIY